MVSKALSIRQVPSGMLLIEDRIGWFVRPRRSVVVDFCASVDGCVRRKALAAVWLLFSGVHLDQPKADSAICCRPQAEKRKVAQMTGKRVQDCASGSAPKGLNSDMFCIMRMRKVYQRAEHPPTQGGRNRCAIFRGRSRARSAPTSGLPGCCASLRIPRQLRDSAFRQRARLCLRLFLQDRFRAPEY